MRFHSQSKSRQGFTLLEVILSVTIMTVIVYSLFIVFDRTMQVIDKIFVGAHKYEVLKNFFENLRRELNSSVANKPGELYRFRGGPHWIEFSTPVLKSAGDINVFIQRGINELTAEFHKVQYFAARPDPTQGTAPGEPAWIFYQLPVFRFEANPTSPLGDPHYSFLVYGANQYPSFTPFLPIVNQWYESGAGRQMVQNWKSGSNSLTNFYDARKVLDARYLKFRYYYTVNYKTVTPGTGTPPTPDVETPLMQEYSQDWWDSAIRYPDVAGANAGDNFEAFYGNGSIWRGNSSVLATEAERLRKYGAGGVFVTGTSPSEYWAYETEPGLFRSFAPSGDWAGSFDPTLSKYDNPSNNRTLEHGDGLITDPWFLNLPSSVEVTVTLFDLQQDPKKPLVTPQEKRDLYRGETFVMRIFLRAHSESVTKYQSNLLTE